MTTDTGEDRNAESKKNVRCWLCHESHKVSDSQTLKNMSIQKKTRNSETQRAVLQLPILPIEYPSN